jgi:uncharacterized protein YhaN
VRINELRLEAFGKFTELALDLSAGREGLHIIVGPNEAGKSTALSAIEQLLFGIPHRSNHAFLHPMQKLRIGGTIVHSSGRSLSFVRRKGQRETLRSADDRESIGENALVPFLGSVDAATFSSMFGLTWEKLQNEGQEIQRGGGEIGPLLFAAGSGIGSLRRVRDRLRADTEMLFLPRGKKKINETIRAIDDRRRELAELTKRSQDRHAIDAGIDQSEALRDRFMEQLRLAQRTGRRLQAIRQALPLVIERSRLDRELGTLTSAIRLPADFRERFQQLAGNRFYLQQQVRSLSKTRSEWEEKRQSIHLDEQILLEADEIESLRHDWGAIEKAARDRIELEVEANQLAERSRQIQRETLGIETPSWSGRDLSIIEELCQRSAELQKRREHLEQKQAGIESRRDRATQEQGAIGQAIDVRGLIDGLREAEEWGNVDSAMEDLDRESTSTREQIELGRSSIGLEGMELERLVRCPWPSEEHVNHFDAEFQDGKLRRSEMTAKIQEMESAFDQLDREIREASVGRALPTLDDLRDSRRVRDELWRDIRQSTDAEQWPSRQAMDEFEQSYRQSDLLADRLREEADQVARLARWNVERSSLEAQIRRERKKLEIAEAEQRELESRWRELWIPIGLKVHPPRAMLAVLRTVGEIITSTRKLRELDSQRRMMAEKREEILRSLSGAFSGVTAPTRFIDAIRQARQVVDQSARQATKQEQLVKVLGEIEREWKDCEFEWSQWEESRTKWQKEWDRARERLAIGDFPTRIVLDWVKGERQRIGIESDREKLLSRIRGIDADAASFSAKMKRWESDGPVTVVELARRLSFARQERARLLEIEEQVRLCESEEASCTQELSRVESQWQALMHEAGTEDESLLPSLMDESDKRRDWERERSRVEQQLAPLAHELQGESLDELAERWNLDDLDREEQEVARSMEEAQGEISRLDQTLGQLRGEQSRIDGNGKGAGLAEQMQTELAMLDRDVQEYLRLMLAGQLLDQTIEQYRRENEGPLLRRASETFRELTCGSFQRLDVEFDDRSQPYLVGVRPGSTESIDVSAMSEGTADQLYLAVRLAAVEQYVASHEPIPFLVDDILINFDDDRAAAALRVLADLSQRTQVIFFTHHAHLVDIARREIPEDLLFVHDLEPRMASNDPPPTGVSTRAKRSKKQPQ